MDPAVLNGEPVIRGTRIPVSVIIGSLSGGTRFDDVPPLRFIGPTRDD